jgi:GDP-L-fucose synthase
VNTGSKIYVAGHRGLVGSAILQRLKKEGYENLVTRTHRELDLRDEKTVDEFFEEQRVDHVYFAAARVGGILANSTYPVEFLSDNLYMQLNVINAAHRHGVRRLMFLGSSCIYPKFAPQPIKEEHLLTGELEPTNEPYALAKIAGIKLCQAYSREYDADFLSVMPTNLYGPGDNFDLEGSHVLPALIRKFHEAKVNDEPRVIVWGTGTPRREFLHVDDLADACVYLMRNYAGGEPLNVGVGKDISIGELAALIREVVDYEGEIVYDRSKPDGTPRKLLDVSKLHSLGWRASIPLREGIEQTYSWFQNESVVRN